MSLRDPRDWGDWSYGPFDTLEEEREERHTRFGGPNCVCCNRLYYNKEEWEEVFKRMCQIIQENVRGTPKE